MERALKITSHIVPNDAASGFARAGTPKSDNDVVIVSAVRTAIAKGKKGTFKDSYPDDLLAAVLKGVVERVKLNPNLVDDIQVGNVLQAGAGAGSSRQAMFYAGFSEKTSLGAVNRQCSSGLQAVANVATAISAGIIDIGIGAGVESMTMGYGADAIARVNPRSEDIPLAADCNLPMGITSENVATKFGISRERQDVFAADSYAKAVAAVKSGAFVSEIVPVTAKVTMVDKDSGKETTTEKTLLQDEGPIATSLEKLKSMKPAFADDGGSTAGNSSQVSDGAAAVLLMRRSKAKELGVPVLARFVAYAVVGCEPSLMGIGPALAIPVALEKAGLKKEQVDVYEINEAFASQAVYCVEKLGLDSKKVNPLGGAIALGHPLGCTGARQIATIIPQLKRTGGKYGVTSMCIGSGMGAASVIEVE